MQHSYHRRARARARAGAGPGAYGGGRGGHAGDGVLSIREEPIGSQRGRAQGEEQLAPVKHPVSAFSRVNDKKNMFKK